MTTETPHSSTSSAREPPWMRSGIVCVRHSHAR